MIPGEYLLNEAAGEIEVNSGRATALVLVKHTGDRPIQVGSHYHFFEVNRALEFDRTAAYGMRLNIAAGTAVRSNAAACRGRGRQRHPAPAGAAGTAIDHCRPDRRSARQ